MQADIASVPSKRGRKRVVSSPRNAAQVELSRDYDYGQVPIEVEVPPTPVVDDMPSPPQPEAAPPAPRPHVVARLRSQWKSSALFACITFAGLFFSAYDAGGPALTSGNVIPRTSPDKVWRVVSSIETWNTWSDAAPAVVREEGPQSSKPGTIQVGDRLFLGLPAPPSPVVGLPRGTDSSQPLGSGGGEGSSQAGPAEWRVGKVVEVEPGSTLCWTVGAHLPSWLRRVPVVGRLFRDRVDSAWSQSGDLAPTRLPHFLLRTQRCILIAPVVPVVQVEGGAAPSEATQPEQSATISESFKTMAGVRAAAAAMVNAVAASVTRGGAANYQQQWFGGSGGVGAGGGYVEVTNSASLAGLLAPLVAARAVGPSWLLPWNRAAGAVVEGGSEGGKDPTLESLAAFNSDLRKKLGR